MNKPCKTCEHYHFSKEELPEKVYKMSVEEYWEWERSVPCRRCKYNDWEDNYKESLKRCPFCGGEARIVVDEDDYSNKDYCVECGSCCADTMWFNSKEEAINAWNRRV